MNQFKLQRDIFGLLRLSCMDIDLRRTAGSLWNTSEQPRRCVEAGQPSERWFQLKYLSLNVVKPACPRQEMPAVSTRCHGEQQRAAVCLSPSDKLFLRHSAAGTSLMVLRPQQRQFCCAGTGLAAWTTVCNA